jgi:hypothetical protein
MVAAACSEKSPSGPDDSLLPTEPVTVTLQVPWDEFAANLRVFGGFGEPGEMLTSVIARAYGGMESRTLVKVGSFPESVQVRDTTGTLRSDTALTFFDAYMVVLFDTLTSTNTVPVTLEMSAMNETWDGGSVTWTNASNQPGAQRPWSQPGGGAVQPISTGVWDPTAPGDSARLYLDSAAIARWSTEPDSTRGARIDLLDDGHRLVMVGAVLRLFVISSLRPDSLIVLSVPTTDGTFIFDPPAAAPSDGMRVGGVPSWRTVLDLNLQSTLTGPPQLCAAVACPFTLGPGNVTYAALALRSRRSEDAFRPTDSLAMEVRAVLSPASLPKSPLSSSLTRPGGTRVRPEVFGPAQEGSLVEVPITVFVQRLLAGPDEAGRPPSNTLALLATPEPSDFSFASFFGPGGATAPMLKLILTVSPPLELP